MGPLLAYIVSIFLFSATVISMNLRSCKGPQKNICTKLKRVQRITFTYNFKILVFIIIKEKLN
jgi:hypothetical protein